MEKVSFLLLLLFFGFASPCAWSSSLVPAPQSTGSLPGFSTSGSWSLYAGQYVEIVVPVSGTLTVSTCSLCSFDTMLSIYDSSLQTAAEVDDSCGLQSTLTASLYSGVWKVALHRFPCTIDTASYCSISYTWQSDGVPTTGVYTTTGIPPLTDPFLCPGPDAFGYVCSVVPMNYETISTQNSLYINDNSYASASIGFTFNFYGNDYQTVYVNQNGFLTFEESAAVAPCCSYGSGFPSQYAPRMSIFPLWVDFSPSYGNFYYQTLGVSPSRRFIIQFTSMGYAHTSSFTYVDFQVVLYEGSNNIEVRYSSNVYFSGYLSSSDVALGGIQRDSQIGLTAFRSQDSSWFVGTQLYSGVQSLSIVYLHPYQIPTTSCPGPDYNGYVCTSAGSTWTSPYSPVPVYPPLDGIVGPFSIGFPFRFYDNDYDTVYIAEDGYITFTNNFTTSLPSHLPSADLPRRSIAAWWANTVGGGSYSYEIQGSYPSRKFIIFCMSIPYSSGSMGAPTGNFQIILYENSTVIDIVYQLNGYQLFFPADGTTVSVGIQFSRSSGLSALSSAYLDLSSFFLRDVFAQNPTYASIRFLSNRVEVPAFPTSSSSSGTSFTSLPTSTGPSSGGHPRDCLSVSPHIDGVYTLDPLQNGQTFQVYCSFNADGAWTLVASSATTFQDQASGYYSDLATLTPTSSAPGIWNIYRSIYTVPKVRFACKRNSFSTVFDVDLAFFETNIYQTITTGTEDQSCFYAGGQTNFPIRKNLRTGQLLLSSDRYGSGVLEGEDSCSSVDDFTIDFNDRGMDSSQDDTDWGVDDSISKCGTGTGTAWFIFIDPSPWNSSSSLLPSVFLLSFSLLISLLIVQKE